MKARNLTNWIASFLLLSVIDVGSGEAGAETRQVQVQAQIHPELPPYRFFLVPDTVYISSDYQETHQTVKLEGERLADPAFLFLLQDINFDGYLDFGTIENGGAKWVLYHFHVFDKNTGQFVTNGLTRAIEQLPANRLYPDGQSRQIYVEHLVVGEGRCSERYEIREGQLVLVEFREKVFDPDREASHFVTKKLINGEMKVVKPDDR